MDTGYFIPFSKEKINEIKNIGLDLGGKVSYSVVTESGLRISVRSFEDLRNADYDELLHFGRKATETEKKLWLERKGGPVKDKERYDEIKMHIDNRDIPERTPTLSEVNRMIKEAATTAKEDEDNKQPKKSGGSKPSKK